MGIHTQSRSLKGTGNLWLLMLSHAVLEIPMPMLIILGSLAGGFVSPRPELATLPPTFQVLAGLATAAPMSLFMGRFGRRAGFCLGAFAMLLGGLCGALGVHQSSFVLLCTAHGFFGISLSCIGYFRFAAAEVAPGDWKASAISLTLAGGLLAALVGPTVFDLTENYLFAVPFVASYLAMSFFAVAGVLPLVFVRFGRVPPVRTMAEQGTSTGPALRRRPIMLAMATAVVAQSAMVLVMTPTPLAMVGYGFDSSDASEVIRWHVVGMFAPSLFTGALINRFGALRIVTLGMLFLLASAAVAIAGTLAVNFFVSLLLLGVGWNFGFVGATFLLSQATGESERGYVQGINDTVIALGSTAAAFLSGIMLASFGWIAVSLLTVPLVLAGLAVLAVCRESSAEAVCP